jgi:hypothetical protein
MSLDVTRTPDRKSGRPTSSAAPDPLPHPARSPRPARHAGVRLQAGAEQSLTNGADGRVAVTTKARIWWTAAAAISDRRLVLIGARLLASACDRGSGPKSRSRHLALSGRQRNAADDQPVASQRRNVGPNASGKSAHLARSAVQSTRYGQDRPRGLRIRQTLKGSIDLTPKNQTGGRYGSRCVRSALPRTRQDEMPQVRKLQPIRPALPS